MQILIKCIAPLIERNQLANAFHVLQVTGNHVGPPGLGDPEEWRSHLGSACLNRMVKEHHQALAANAKAAKAPQEPIAPQVCRRRHRRHGRPTDTMRMARRYNQSNMQKIQRGGTCREALIGSAASNLLAGARRPLYVASRLRAVRPSGSRCAPGWKRGVVPRPAHRIDLYGSLLIRPGRSLAIAGAMPYSGRAR